MYKNGVTNRSLTKLYPIEVTASNVVSICERATDVPDVNDQDQGMSDSSLQVDVCPGRRAARWADNRYQNGQSASMSPPLEDVGDHH